jgi:hypothetical protein
LIAALFLAGLALSPVHAGIIFSDNFDSGAAPEWGNESGAWSDSGGVYRATAPDNFPNAFSSLPFDLTDFELEVDVNDVNDGGIWLRSAAAPGTSIGITGVLLVTRGDLPGGAGFYWHVVTNGNTYGDLFGLVTGIFNVGDDLRLRITVVGDTYSVYLNGSATAATTLVSSAFASGRVALYDYNLLLSFDNVVLSSQTAVVPEPSSLFLAACGLGGLLAAACRDQFEKRSHSL